MFPVYLAIFFNHVSHCSVKVSVRHSLYPSVKSLSHIDVIVCKIILHVFLCLCNYYIVL
jgi:hypothetical protein